MVLEASRIADKCYQNNIGFKLYSPSKKKKFKSGTIHMNSILRALQHGHDENSIFFGPYEYSVGDMVLFNKNNYEKKYYNGQEGIIRDIQNHNGTVHMSIEADGERVNLTGTEIGDIELGYAITAHKSQGGECDHAIILVPKEPRSLLKRQLLYVEITRAREGVILLCEQDALNQLISTKGTIHRETGLRELLIKSVTMQAS